MNTACLVAGSADVLNKDTTDIDSEAMSDNDNDAQMDEFEYAERAEAANLNDLQAHYDLDLPMEFGTESTLVSREALEAIEQRIQWEHREDTKIAAYIMEQHDSIWEATTRGLILGRMGPLAHGLYAIESLYQSNARARSVITCEHHQEKNLVALFGLIYLWKYFFD
jgi:hypothetical protein